MFTKQLILLFIKLLYAHAISKWNHSRTLYGTMMKLLVRSGYPFYCIGSTSMAWISSTSAGVNMADLLHTIILCCVYTLPIYNEKSQIIIEIE